MLSRDSHNRFPLKESFAFKNKFYDTPVVNEYVEILWNMLAYLDCKQERKKRNFNVILTHDVDYPLFSSRNIFKAIGADLIVRKKFFQCMFFI